MGTIPLPLPWYDEHRAGHPPALTGGRDPKGCPFCKAGECLDCLGKGSFAVYDGYMKVEKCPTCSLGPGADE